MERLTKRLDGGNFMVSASHDMDPYLYNQDNIFRNAISKLADYEDAEEQGRLIELPVGIDGTIWEVIPVNEGHIRELKVKSITIWDDGTYLFNCSDGVYESSFNSRRLGTLMFLTREEAEAKLKELEEEDHA